MGDGEMKQRDNFLPSLVCASALAVLVLAWAAGEPWAPWVLLAGLWWLL